MSQAAIPIYQGGRDFYRPKFQLKLNGQPAAQDVIHDVLELTYRDDIESLDSFEVTLNNWDEERRRLKYSDTTLFQPGKELQLLLGYHGPDPLRLMTTGVITGLGAAFPASGPPTLSVSGQNLLHLFRRAQESHVYEKKTDSEIAREVCKRLAVELAPKTPPAKEPRYGYVAQENEYDIVFLYKRARGVGYDLFVQEAPAGGPPNQRSLYFGPSVGVRRSVYRLAYGTSLIDFTADLRTDDQVAEVKVLGWQQDNKREIEATATRRELATRGIKLPGFQSDAAQAFAGRREVITCRPVENAEEAKKLAVETLQRNAHGLMRASGATVGLPDLRAGTVVEIDKLGTTYSGRYFVTGTIHTVGDSGYVTRFQCRREEV